MKGLTIVGAILAIATLALLLISLSYGMPLPVGITMLDKKLGEMLWGYRAIDMLTQALLILGAACGVTALFRVEPPKEVAEEEQAVIEAPLEEVVETAEEV
ncbi:MAG: hypothetical protein LM598_02995 [Candidatus Verstraetearchaeota archaeon]|jgi:uncharacterized BrkB/YihY/UPF0761 family membrane protein|nr:hypothetical protein [Candidatus Verstraetearchaeota archaeon]